VAGDAAAVSRLDPQPEAGQYVRKLYHVDRVATPGQKLMWAVEAFGWDWLYWKPFAAMNIEQASNAGASLFARLGPLTSAHRSALRNLRMAFPDWPETQIAEAARGAWRNFGHIAGELPHFREMRPYHADGRIEVVNVERLDALRDGGTPAVLIGGHFANWECLAAAICNRVPSARITYRPANNPHIDRRIAEARAAYGIQVLIPKGAGTRDLMRALSSGESVGLMNDQKFNQGVPVPFFGHDAMTAPGPTRLAMRYGIPLVPFSVRRTGLARYRVTIHDDIWPETGPSEEAAIYATLLRINRFMEDRIREAPDQWFWQHNRWPKEAWRAAGVM
jgi:Kdo2-lipid IVA lauroyltransferase/acyltransferase